MAADDIGEMAYDECNGGILLETEIGLPEFGNPIIVYYFTFPLSDLKLE